MCGCCFQVAINAAAFGLVRRESAHDAEAVGVEPGRFQRSIVAVGFPGRRHEHATRDAGAVHLAQQFVVAERHGRGGAWTRFLWRTVFPVSLAPRCELENR